jgi:hypothetical protein
MNVAVWFRQRLPLRLTWQTVARALDLQGTSIKSVRATRMGVAAELRLSPPTTAGVVESKSDAIAVAYGAVRVRVRPSEVRADRVLLRIDFAQSVGIVSLPDIQHPVGLPLDPIRQFALGIDDDGDIVSGSFYGHHILIGGIPGSGKSNAIRVFLAHLATSRNIALFGIDPKRVELGLWRERFSGLVLGNGAGETIALLELLHEHISDRTKHLSAIGETILLPSHQFPWIVLIVDEWAEVAAGGTKKERELANDLLRRYVSLGRAVGCTAIFCTQRPTSDVIDVGTRTLLNDRFALRCGDRYQAEAILSAGTFEPKDLIGATVGRALWSEGGPAIPLQFFEVSAERISHLTCPGYAPTSRETRTRLDFHR